MAIAYSGGAMTALDGWENFYVIVGSSAAALTGLMFVVVSLTSERRANYEDGAVNAFATPTVLHFCFVLLIAAIISTPRHTVRSLRISLGVAGGVGLAYTIYAVMRMRRQKEYTPVLEDWVWHVTFPLLAYTCITTACVLALRADVTLYLVAASALLLLYVGIHNAWDAAMWIAVHDPKAKPQE